MSKGDRKRRKAKMRGSRAQMSLHAAEGSFKAVEKKTRRRAFLEVMDKVVPWERLVALVRPYYSEGAGEKGGRPAVGLERMLRIYFVQQWLNLSDPGVEEEMYESESIRWFVGWIWGASGRRMRPRYVGFVTCWSSTGWGRGCCGR
jgi:hypothetical protein